MDGTWLTAKCWHCQQLGPLVGSVGLVMAVDRAQRGYWPAVARDEKKTCKPRGCAGLDPKPECLALQQLQHGLGLLVGLGQHGGGRLRDDLCARQLAAGFGVVSIHDAAARL